MTVLFTARLLLAAIVTALSGSLVFSFHESAAAGQGMAKAFALLASISLWVVLGGLVLICIKRGGLPGRTAFVALVQFVAVAAGHFAAFGILGRLPARDRFELPLQFVAVAS
jgi:hypothetical protein